MRDLMVVSPDEVELVISKLPRKSSPLDIMPTSLMKSCKSEIATMVANIANASFSLGLLSSRMKLGEITKLIKKHELDESNNANFRPITNVSTVLKLLERLALSRLR